ncbi:MAG TPA: hypothetical protein VFR15_04790 [Chloroflexia bacterium]|nr:hypothetical protein [Chloroflexia bacterium]
MDIRAKYDPQRGLPVRLRTKEAMRSGALAAANGLGPAACKYKSGTLREWWQIGYDEELERLQEGGIALRRHEKMIIPFRRFKERLLILTGEDADRLRAAYVDRFVDMTTDHALQYETLREYSDGLGYTGYLWDTLKSCSTVIREEEAILDREEQMLKRVVYVMWDLHTAEKWLTWPPPWIFRRDVVLKGRYQDILAGQAYLQNDLYVYDDSLAWTLIFTHEADESGNSRLYLETPCL